VSFPIPSGVFSWHSNDPLCKAIVVAELFRGLEVRGGIKHIDIFAKINRLQIFFCDKIRTNLIKSIIITSMIWSYNIGHHFLKSVKWELISP